METKPASWALALIGPAGDEGDHPPPLAALFRRLAFAIALAAVYGLAVGLRRGGSELASHALGVPAGVLAVLVLGLPALFILLAITGSTVDARHLFADAVRSIAIFGVAAAGIAPVVGFFGVTAGGDGSAALIAGLGLAVAGGLGFFDFVRKLFGLITKDERPVTQLATVGISAGFTVFALILTTRVWLEALPLLGGSS